MNSLLVADRPGATTNPYQAQLRAPFPGIEGVAAAAEYALGVGLGGADGAVVPCLPPALRRGSPDTVWVRAGAVLASYRDRLGYAGPDAEDDDSGPGGDQKLSVDLADALVRG